MAAASGRAGPESDDLSPQPNRATPNSLSPSQNALREPAVAVRSNQNESHRIQSQDRVSRMSVSAFYKLSPQLFYWRTKHPIYAGPAEESFDFGDTNPPNVYEYTVSSGRPGTTVQAFKCRTAKAFDYLAVKEIPYTSDNERDRAKNEVEQLLRVRHNHIIVYVGSYLSRQSKFKQKLSIMLYPLARWNLADFLEHSSKYSRDGSDPELDPHHLMRYFACLCCALEYLHQLKIQHRDVKPENVLIDQYCNVLFADFGISKHYNTPDPVSNGTTDCTIQYGAKEVVSGGEREGMSSVDTFSLGCVFLEMATVVLGRSIAQLYDRVEEPKDSHHSGRIIIYWSAVANGKVRDWIQHLGELVDNTQQNKSDGVLTRKHLDMIEKMMSNDSTERPKLCDVRGVFEPLRGICEACRVPLSSGPRKGSLDDIALSRFDSWRDTSGTEPLDGEPANSYKGHTVPVLKRVQDSHRLNRVSFDATAEKQHTLTRETKSDENLSTKKWAVSENGTINKSAAVSEVHESATMAAQLRTGLNPTASPFPRIPSISPQPNPPVDLDVAPFEENHLPGEMIRNDSDVIQNRELATSAQAVGTVRRGAMPRIYDPRRKKDGVQTLTSVSLIPGKYVIEFDPEKGVGSLLSKDMPDYNKGILMPLPRFRGSNFKILRGVYNLRKVLSFRLNMKRYLGAARFIFILGDYPEHLLIFDRTRS